MTIQTGKKVKQKDGYTAFVPNSFPPTGIFDIPIDILIKAAEADRLIGKLDGITNTLPDLEFFLHMFVTKDATSSSQIEGTKATIIDAIELDAGLLTRVTDASDILFYIDALNYGIKRLLTFPLSLRLIRETHKKLMTGGRSSHFANLGEFRSSQNWIGGTAPSNALYVPPPVTEMKSSLSDFEKFLHNENVVPPLIHIGVAHAHFETIHPFLDGNGRTGRLLITMLLCHRNLLEKPILFLSSYFRKHQKVYYQKLNAYHDGEVHEWISFFLDGVIETANDSILISKEIRSLRDKDMAKIQVLAKRESESSMLVLSKLYAKPIVNVRTIMDWTKFTRPGAQKVVDRFIKMGILVPQKEEGVYDQTYLYSKYLKIFTS